MSARVIVTSDENVRLILAGHGDEVDGAVVEVVELSILDQIYGVRCTGDTIDECPDTDDLAETWGNREDPITWAVEHVEKHEARS